jgi:hypothetical protein
MRGEKKGSKGADVVDINSRRFRGKTIASDDPRKRKVSSFECLTFLGQVAPLDENKTKKLNLPKELYLGDTDNSYSRNPDDDVVSVRNDLLFLGKMPDELPDFAIDVTSKGSNTFCILVDKKRKIIIADPISNMYADQGSWDTFFRSIDEALAAVKKFEGEGRKIEYVVINESLMSVKDAS